MLRRWYQQRCHRFPLVSFFQGHSPSCPPFCRFAPAAALLVLSLAILTTSAPSDPRAAACIAAPSAALVGSLRGPAPHVAHLLQLAQRFQEACGAFVHAMNCSISNVVHIHQNGINLIAWQSIDWEAQSERRALWSHGEPRISSACKARRRPLQRRL